MNTGTTTTPQTPTSEVSDRHFCKVRNEQYYNTQNEQYYNTQNEQLRYKAENTE